MKKIAKLITVVLFTLLCAIPVFAQQGDIHVYLNDSEITFDVQPQIINNTTMVPLRSIFESMDYEVYWDDKTKTVTGMGNENIIQLTINNATGYKNGEPIAIETPPQIVDGATLVPLRFIAESAGATVDWDEATYTVYIFTPEGTTASVDDSITLEEKLKRSTVLINTNEWQGSGVILSSDGYIVTNYHVLEGASLIRVEFYDRSLYTGEVHIAGYDTARDLVVIKIDAQNLTFAPMGDSDAVEIGDSVTAVGSPNGILNTVTTGAITDKTDFIISSSAYITGGSSGGGLFNAEGEVIGVNSSYDTIEHYMAIPINYVRDLDTTSNIPLNKWKDIEPDLATPITFSYTADNNSAQISWDPVYSADGYRIYSSYTVDGKYTVLKNPSDGSNVWNWGFPYCFKITASRGQTFYFKIASIRDGVESPLSEAYKVEM